MKRGPFAEVPELGEIRDAWIREGLRKVPMGITEKNRAKLDELNIKTVQGTIPFSRPSLPLLGFRQELLFDGIRASLNLIDQVFFMQRIC
jgi:hypothetical protein